MAGLQGERRGRKEAGAGRTFIIGGNWKCSTDAAKVNEITGMLNGMPSIPPTVSFQPTQQRMAVL
jgi:hypothetical protein